MKETVNTSKENKNDTLNTLDISGSTPRTNLSNKSTKIGKTPEINIQGEILSVSVLSVKGESLASVTPDNICIPR